MAQLTHKEKAVLYGLIRFPDLNDIELAQLIRIKRPTITAIRNRFEAGGLYSMKRIPDLRQLGCELIVATYTQYNPLTSYETRKKNIKENPTTFIEIQADSQQLTLSAAKNYTEAKKQLNQHIRVNEKFGYSKKNNITSLFFPLELSIVLMDCAFGPLIRKNFSLDADDDADEVPSQRRGSVELTKHERLVLYALVKYPTLKEKEIAEKTLLTRQTVNSINRKLKSEGVIKTVRIPDLRKLGLEVVVFSTIVMRPTTSLEERMRIASKVVREGSQVFIISNLTESVMVSFSKSYTEVQKTYRELLELYSKHNFLERRPTLKIMPVDEIKCLKCDYAEVTRHLLNIETVI